MAERMTTLLDDLKAHPAMPVVPVIKTVMASAPSARRYVFDAEASTRTGAFLRDNIDLAIDNIEFARAPYPTTYMEFDAAALWTAHKPDVPQRGVDKQRVGFLIHGDTVLTLLGSADSGNAVRPGYIAFRINRPQARSLSHSTGYGDERDDLIKQAYVLGGRRELGDQPLTRATLKRLDHGQGIEFPALPKRWSPSQVAAHFDMIPVFPDLPKDDFVEMAFLAGSDPLVAVAALLLLNQPSDRVGLRTIPGSRGLYRGKLKSYKAHNIVSIGLDSKPLVVRDWSVTDRASPVVHDVEGHWKNYNKHAGCEHSWEPVGDLKTLSGDYKHYWCPDCLQRRTWTEAHVRGDALRGLATKDYQVRA